MINLRWRAALTVAALLMVTAIAGRAGEAIRWKTNFAAAKAEAKKNHKLILADFYADW